MVLLSETGELVVALLENSGKTGACLPDKADSPMG